MGLVRSLNDVVLVRVASTARDRSGVGVGGSSVARAGQSLGSAVRNLLILNGDTPWRRYSMSAADEAEQGARIARDQSTADLLALSLPIRLFEAIMARTSMAEAAVFSCGCHPADKAAGWRADGDGAIYTDDDTAHTVAGGTEWPAYIEPDVAVHMALHDPADALRRYAADFKTLAEHMTSGGIPVSVSEDGTFRQTGPPESGGWCMGSHSEPERAPCPVLRRMATVYPEVSE